MKRFVFKSFLVVLSCLVVLAFMPAMSFADESISIEDQTVMDNGIAVKVTLNTSDFEIDQIKQDGGDAFVLKDGDYRVEGDAIIFTKKFLQGDSGFAPTDNKWSFQISFTNGDVVYTKDIKCYNISGLSGPINGDFVYNGKQRSINKVDMNGNLKKGRDYKIVYAKSKRKAIGHYKFTIKGIGKYKGTKKSWFDIIPKMPKITSAKRTKSTATIKWKKVKNCSGYVVTLWKWNDDEDSEEGGWYSEYKKSTVKGKSKTSKIFKNVKRSKYDRVTIKSYKVVKGKKYFSYERERSF